MRAGEKLEGLGEEEGWINFLESVESLRGRESSKEA